MKIIKTLGLLFTFCFFIACGGDEDCTADDWVGTWSGSISCDDGTTETATVVITKVDESTISLTYDGESSNIQVSGCKFDFSGQLSTFLGDLDVDYNGDLNGDQMAFDVTVGLFGVEVSCDGNLSR